MLFRSRDALKSNKKVVLPKVDMEKKELRLYYITGIDELKSGFLGIPEPEGDEKREVLLKIGRASCRERV